MIVREALVSDPRVLPGDATPQQVAELLTHPHVESALVVDGERLVGCITPETLVSAIAEGRDLGSVTAADLADGEVPTIGPDESLEELEVSERDIMHGGALAAAELSAPVEGDAPPGAYTCC